MRYVSIDIETLGTDPRFCDVIEFGAVIDDRTSPLDALPRFHTYVLPPERRVGREHHRFYRGQPFAMAMHKDKLERIASRDKGYDYADPGRLGEEFAHWLVKQGFQSKWDIMDTVEVVVAGKNFAGFDQRFLRHLPNFGCCVSIFRRIMDPCMMYFDPKADAKPPSLDDCLKRAGFDKTVDHTAVGDALDVVRVLRHKWGVA
jgi:oligoribonuclease